MLIEYYVIKYRWKDHHDTRVSIKKYPTLEDAKAWVEFVKDGIGDHEFIHIKVDDNGIKTAETISEYEVSKPPPDIVYRDSYRLYRFLDRAK